MVCCKACYIGRKIKRQRFTDIYPAKKCTLKKIVNPKRLKLYLWAALAFFVLGCLTDLAEEHSTYFQRVLDDGWRVIYVTIINYFLFEVTLPKLTWKETFMSALRVLGYIFIYSFGLYGWRGIGIAIHIYTPFNEKPHEDQVAVQMGYSVGSVIFFGIVRHIYNYIKLKQSAQQLLIEKQRAELNYLKSQTNPHFLFNTLNNIYSLARSKSDLAPESILRLSKILRYMLYEAGGAYTAIEQDLKIISDYIELEKLRYDETLQINFNYDIEDMKQALPPLLLIPLVENAFKHGVSETRNRPFVDIHLSIKNRRLAFFVKNSSEVMVGEGPVKENIGLANLRRQLQLLYTDYSLDVKQENYEFTAVLKINLASHV